jgi:hypothetical protein
MAQLIIALIPGLFIDVLIGVAIFRFTRNARAYEVAKQDARRAVEGPPVLDLDKLGEILDGEPAPRRELIDQPTN